MSEPAQHLKPAGLQLFAEKLKAVRAFVLLQALVFPCVFLTERILKA
jgi:hypothetical protein